MVTHLQIHTAIAVHTIVLVDKNIQTTFSIEELRDMELLLAVLAESKPCRRPRYVDDNYIRKCENVHFTVNS